jgi:hypothetical protein
MDFLDHPAEILEFPDRRLDGLLDFRIKTLSKKLHRHADRQFLEIFLAERFRVIRHR